MAYIEYTKAEKEGQPASVEKIEVRPWALGGDRSQAFFIGNGVTVHATDAIWMEIIYTVGGAQFFYTRNFLDYWGSAKDGPKLKRALEKFRLGKSDRYGFGGNLPDTSIHLTRHRYTDPDENGKETTGEYFDFEISIDAGALIGQSSPAMRMINIHVDLISLEAGLKFMQDLNREIVSVHRGKHPNPANLPVGGSDWPFVRQLNQNAYDLISPNFQEDYFANPLLTEMFDAWLEQLPVGGHVLDAGCGNGKPVIARLLEQDYRVTGTDISPKMLEGAKGNFPTATFANQMVSELRCEAEYDGVCSFSALLYLDPIDLSHSLYRLFHALKPGGLLFLYADDLQPFGRGNPYHVDLKHWLWSWTYGMEEAAQALEEFGYFKVLKMQNVTTAAQQSERIAAWHKDKPLTPDKIARSIRKEAEATAPLPGDLPYSYALIAQRRNR